MKHGEQQIYERDSLDFTRSPSRATCGSAIATQEQIHEKRTVRRGVSQPWRCRNSVAEMASAIEVDERRRPPHTVEFEP